MKTLKTQTNSKDCSEREKVFCSGFFQRRFAGRIFIISTKFQRSKQKLYFNFLNKKAAKYYENHQCSYKKHWLDLQNSPKNKNKIFILWHYPFKIGRTKTTCPRALFETLCFWGSCAILGRFATQKENTHKNNYTTNDLYLDAKAYVYVVPNVLAKRLRSAFVVRSFATFSQGCQHEMLPGWLENYYTKDVEPFLTAKFSLVANGQFKNGKFTKKYTLRILPEPTKNCFKMSLKNPFYKNCYDDKCLFGLTFCIFS